MRSVYVRNFDHDTRQTDLEMLFSFYGRVDRIDIKFGYAFVYFEHERDAEVAISELHNIPFGHKRRKLFVEWAKESEHGPRGHDGSRSRANMRPRKTLFVINFDPIRTRERDIERHFELYGTILNVRIKRNFAFVRFEKLEEATKALESTNMTKILDRVISVEYAREYADLGNTSGSPRRSGGYGRRDASSHGRSDSPGYRRGRPSPDYGRPRIPVYDRYGSYHRSRSPVYERYRR